MSAILSPARLDALSQLLGRARPSVCRIERLTGAEDAGGSPEPVYAEVATVDCRAQASARVVGENLFGGRIAPVTRYDVYLPRGTDVRADDRIVVDGATLEIDEIANALDSFQVETLVRAMAAQ